MPSYGLLFFLFYLSVLNFLITDQVLANEQTPPCQWENWPELAQYVSESSPDVLSLRSQVEAKEALIDTAELSPPAVATGQYTIGGMPWKESTLEASYLWTIEADGKRRSRRGAADAEVEAARSSIEDIKATQLLRLVLLQQAIKRLEARSEVLIETRETYRKILRQFQAKPILGPEQEVSLSVFQIAKKDNELKIEALNVEKSQLRSELIRLTGCPSPVFPKTKERHFESLSFSKTEEKSKTSPALELLKSESKKLDSAIDAEIENLKPDFSVGPTIIAERSDETNRLEIGIAASMPIGSQRVSIVSRAKAKEKRALHNEILLKESRLSQERQAWVDVYESSVKAMKSGLTKGEIFKAHHKIEDLFRSERVSAALVIESHRQLLEHIETYTELESKATEALWNIRYLDGHLKGSDL